jgi:8-oxo-dGTP pyrophosphatase MutT (NUDIX family)
MSDASAMRAEPRLDPRDVPIRPAATVMLIRDAEDGGGGVEVFMLRRTLAAVFGSGMYVFPGGRVETSDGVDIDAAHRLAAIRECFEEAGVLLAVDASGALVTDDHPVMALRDGVNDGSVDLFATCAAHGLRPTVDAMVWVSHWITPIGEQRRFDTRFYLVPAPASQSSTHDDGETIDSLWTRPADALARAEAGELTMMPPTVKNLQMLSRFGSVAEAMAAAAAMPPPTVILPKIRLGDDGRILGVLLPDEPGYTDLP